MNGYICFHKGKKYEVYAETLYKAQLKCAAEHGIKKTWEIRVVLAEKDGQPVIHQPQELEP